MSQVKDPKIKLFGKTIELPEKPAAAGELGWTRSSDPAVEVPACSSDSIVEDAEGQESVKTLSLPEQDHSNKEARPEPLKPTELTDSNIPPPTTTDSNAPSNSDTSMKTSKTDEDQTESSSNNNSNEKALKKPDKILPCPRCNSMDTKFCYFNNYNVNQPRHFCKNCQRYWTAGGTMRNVPVGAGRRKNKTPSISQFHHLTIPDALSANGTHYHPNGTVLKFGSESPLRESVASVPNISINRPHKPEEPKENGDNFHTDKVGGKTRLSEPMQLSDPFSYPGPHWPYSWNPIQWGPGGTFPVPPSYWGWSIPWVIAPAPSALGPNSSTLGKHSREDDVDVKENAKEDEMVKEKKCLWVPKTLRIDDPGEAAKSSIWEMLGIRNDRVGGGGGGLFKAFRAETKDSENARVLESSTVLQAKSGCIVEVSELP